jgi:hypothetical protein
MNYSNKFNELPWHDSALLNIEIDRKKPGENDSIKLSIKWPDGNENLVVFSNCYCFDAKMNFGIVAEESILSADCRSDCEEIPVIKNKWAPLGVELDNLLCYTINTNSTNSSIKILALSMDIV